MGVATKEKPLTFEMCLALKSMEAKPLKKHRQTRWMNRHGKVISARAVDDLAGQGLVTFGSGAAYARLSAAGRRMAETLAQICCKCGCHDLKACEEGCSWAAPDLCSACVEGKP